MLNQLKYKVWSINKSQAGFTFVEIMVSLVLLIMLVFAAYSFVVGGYRLNLFGTQQNTAIHNARRAAEIMASEIREAIQSNRGDYALAAIGNQNFSFYADVDDDGEVEMTRYFLDGGTLTLKREITEPGSPPDYLTPDPATIIAEHINNQSENIFIYYNDTGAITANINEVRLVRIVLKINVDPSKAPQDYYLETDITLRNLKDNL